MASIQSSDMEKQSHETLQLLCSTCKRKERNKEADKYCADCNDYYCSDCVKFHEDIPFLSGHKILDKGQSGEGKSKSLPIAPTERCERHRFKPVDMYCQNHDDVGCYTCMAVDHRSCKDIFDIPEFVQNNKAHTDAKEIQEELTSTKIGLEETLCICKGERDRLLKGKEEALHKVQDFRMEIDERLDILEQNSIDSIEKKYKVLIDKINGEIQFLENSQTEVASAKDKMTLSGSNISQVFVTSKLGKRATESAVKCKEEISKGKNEINIKFTKDEKLLTFLAHMDTFGRIRQSNDLYKVKEKKTYYIRHQSDKQACTISSMCILEDGSTILADKSNKNLKRIDSMYTNIDVCDLPEAPYQICTIDEQNVAAIAANGENIYFISVTNEMKRTKVTKLDHELYGIGFANDNLYVADSNTSVFIYGMTGTRLKQYTRDQTGKALFRSIYSISVSIDGRRIYVADSSYGVVVLSGDGTLQENCDCSELVRVRRVCFAENGSFLASGDSNNSILQFTLDGEKLGNVLSSDTGIEKCQAICFDHRKCRILVGRENKDEIDIYDLMQRNEHYLCLISHLYIRI